VCELAPGGDVEEFYTKRKNFKKPLTETESSKIMRQLIFGLNYMHQRGIIHRDLKPANMLMMDSNDLSIKITDFGTATYFHTIRDEYGIGSPAYCSPEMLINKGIRHDTSTDIWSVGVIAYELLTNGLMPFPEDEDIEILEKQIEKNKVTFPNNVSKEAKDFILSCL
jgi:serine/threonine protein kinase